MKRAEMHGIPAFTFSPKDFPSKDCYEEALFDLFAHHRIDYLILAGYLRIIGKKLLQAFPNRIINIHPSLLPAFPGLHGIEDAFSYGVKMTGVTVHFVDDGVDTGYNCCTKKCIDLTWGYSRNFDRKNSSGGTSVVSQNDCRTIQTGGSKK